jgi:hypothetical protein
MIVINEFEVNVIKYLIILGSLYESEQSQMLVISEFEINVIN